MAKSLTRTELLWPLVRCAKVARGRFDNLVLLCRRHHRLIHEGGASLSHENGDLVFRNAHGVLLERCAARFDGRFRGNVVELSRQHEAMGLSINKRTAVGRWDGEPLD